MKTKEAFIQEDEVTFSGGHDEVRVNIGTSPAVIIDKLYGPTASCDLRVSVDMKVCQWVIERKRYLDSDGLSSEWVVVACVDLQPEDDPLWNSTEP